VFHRERERERKKERLDMLRNVPQFHEILEQLSYDILTLGSVHGPRAGVVEGSAFVLTCSFFSWEEGKERRGGGMAEQGREGTGKGEERERRGKGGGRV
jgi:hypothetical protein